MGRHGEEQGQLAADLRHTGEEEPLPQEGFKGAPLGPYPGPRCPASQDGHETVGRWSQATPRVHQEGMEGPSRSVASCGVLGAFVRLLGLPLMGQAGRVPDWLMWCHWTADSEVNGRRAISIPPRDQKVRGTGSVTKAPFPLNRQTRIDQEAKPNMGIPNHQRKRHCQ